MSQRDLVAELRATRITAPVEVREHVRLIAAADTSTRGPRDSRLHASVPSERGPGRPCDPRAFCGRPRVGGGP